MWAIQRNLVRSGIKVASCKNCQYAVNCPRLKSLKNWFETHGIEESKVQEAFAINVADNCRKFRVAISPPDQKIPFKKWLKNLNKEKRKGI